MEPPERLILDWLIAVAADPERDPRSDDQMKEFGLNDDQRSVLLRRDQHEIRHWILYELSCHPQYFYSTGGTHHLTVTVTVTHAGPPPPPKP